jgi:hypothetical protein
MISVYLEGVEHSLYVASAQMTAQREVAGFFCMPKNKGFYEHELIELLQEYERSKPYVATWQSQATILHVLEDAYPCPSRGQ